jgi:hypothetical protein
MSSYVRETEFRKRPCKEISFIMGKCQNMNSFLTVGRTFVYVPKYLDCVVEETWNGLNVHSYSLLISWD